MAELSEKCTEREILYHLHDLESEPTAFELFNELFAILNKNILNCSQMPVDMKRSIKEDYYKLKLGADRKKQLTRKELNIKARKNKYEGLVL